MRRGLIAIDTLVCDSCGRTIEHPEHYLVIDEEEKTSYYCTDCSISKGFAHYKIEKGEKVLTVFPE